jgi:hypothetical protein
LASRLELKVSSAGQRDGETLTDESNEPDETAARFWQRHPANNPEETPNLMAMAAPPIASPLPISKTTNLTRSRSLRREVHARICAVQPANMSRVPPTDGGKRRCGNERLL